MTTTTTMMMMAMEKNKKVKETGRRTMDLGKTGPGTQEGGEAGAVDANCLAAILSRGQVNNGSSQCQLNMRPSCQGKEDEVGARKSGKS